MKRTDRLAIVALNAAGLETARNLQRVLGNGAVHAPGRLADQGEATFDDAVAHFRSLFAAGCPIAGVCASGILIRALAPLLADKHDEPPVVAVSVDGDVAVPLLGGHKGANRLAREIARQLDGVAAITTASESTSGVALDDPPPGWRLAEDSDIRGITSAMLNDEPVALKVDAGDAGWLRGAADWQADAPCTIVLSDRASATGDVTLRPASLVLGLGCERGADEAETVAFVEQVLGESDLAAESLAAVASLDLKADEPAMRAVAAHFGVPLRLFDAATLEAETPRLANPSDIVYQAVGCHGVAEGAALAGAGPDGTLVVEKQKTARATCAIARGAGVVLSESIGHGLGRLTVVGIGPGTADWRTGAVASAISGARHLVGYSLYLDLLGAAAGHAKRHEFPLGAETERARAALDLAAGGEHVALVCSGDAGIYGMASLVFELLDQVEEPRWRFVDVRVEPGISAMQAAAARAGAPLGHDFCAISLSDLLTPWPAIERRLEAAADADFVIALYNPAGRKRRAPLNRALEILRSKRPAACPVIIARNLGREAENIRIVPLGELDGDSIDMLSVLIFGNSETRHGAGAGRAYAYTPRGYGRKNEGAA